MFTGKHSSAWCFSLLLALSTAPGQAATKIDLEREKPVPSDQPIPTQDFFRPRVLSQPVINRAGTHIAAVVTAGEDKHNLMVYDIAKNEVQSTGSNGDKDIYNVHWLNDSRVLFHLSSRKMYGLGMMAADVGNLGRAYPIQQYNASSIVSIPLKDPLHPLVWNRSDIETQRDAGVVRLNTSIQTGTIVDLTAANATRSIYIMARENNDKCTMESYAMPPGSAITYSYMADKVGELAYAFTSDKGNLSMYRFENKNWLKCPVDLEQVDIVGNANEPGQLLVVGPWQPGKPRPLQFMEAATGKLGEVLLQDASYDFNGWAYRNPATGDVLGVIFQKGGPRVYWFNEQYKALQKILDGMFPGQVVRIIGSDDKHNIFLVATSSDRQPTIYQWVNLETRKAGIFKQSAPWIDAQRMQPMQIMSFKTRDGQKLDGYLTLPAGITKEKPAPLVVLCHGGPWARDNWGFNGEVQFLAYHGYAVLQPNYRGSVGSVGRFAPEDEYDFIKMHQDVTDAVKTVLGTGLIDKERVGIMGASFGGYLAISGVAHEPDLYRCAVTNAGVFDWAMQFQDEKYDQYDNPSYGRRVKKMGDPKVETEKFRLMSPINFVQAIKAPVFVAGGKDDQVVEIQQSRKLISALDKSNVPYEKYFVGGEGHGMAYLKHDVEYYDLVLAFLDKNLKPKK